MKLRNFFKALALVAALIGYLHPAPARAQFEACLPAFCSSQPITNCTEASAFISRANALTALNPTHITAYTNLICGLVATGVWPKIDALYVYATQTSTIALLNLKSATYNSTLVGAPVFTVDQGFTGVAASAADYINTNFNPSVGTPVFATDSAHIAHWLLSGGSSSNPAFGAHGAGGNFATYMLPLLVADSYFRVNVNPAIGQSVHNPTADATGFWVATRPSAGILKGYRQGAPYYSAGVGQPSVAIVNENFYSAGLNANGVPNGSEYPIAAASVGSDLDDTDNSNYYFYMRGYMTAMGIP